MMQSCYNGPNCKICKKSGTYDYEAHLVQCYRCLKMTDILYNDSDCGDCMEIRHKEVNKRLQLEAMENSLWEDS